MLLGWLALIFPPGRMVLAAAGARFLLRGVEPGRYPRGGKIHLRVWLAERFTDECNATGLSGAPYITWYARLLGAQVGPDVDLHTVPPVTGLLHLGPGASVEPEVDLRTTWLDGDVLTVAPVRIGKRARIGARSTLAPGASVGADAEIAPGSGVLGHVPAGEYWSGAPAERARRGPGALGGLPPGIPALVARDVCRERGCAGRHTRRGGRGGGGRPRGRHARGGRSPGTRSAAGLVWLPVAAAATFATLALLVARRHPAGRGRAGARALPGPQPLRLAGLGDHPAARRGPHLAVPALQQQPHPAVAACARGADRP